MKEDAEIQARLLIAKQGLRHELTIHRLLEWLESRNKLMYNVVQDSFDAYVRGSCDPTPPTRD